MLSEVLSCDLGVGGVAPLDLVEPSQCVAEMGEVESPCDVVVGKPPKTLAFGCLLYHSERGIRELPDVGVSPSRRLCPRNAQDNETQRYENPSPG